MVWPDSAQLPYAYCILYFFNFSFTFTFKHFFYLCTTLWDSGNVVINLCLKEIMQSTGLLQISPTHYWAEPVLVYASYKKGTAPHEDDDVLLLHQLRKAEEHG